MERVEKVVKLPSLIFAFLLVSQPVNMGMTNNFLEVRYNLLDVPFPEVSYLHHAGLRFELYKVLQLYVC